MEVLPVELHQPSAREQDEVGIHELWALLAGIASVGRQLVPLPPEEPCAGNASLHASHHAPGQADHGFDESASKPTAQRSALQTDVDWNDLHVVPPQLPQHKPGNVPRSVGDDNISEVSDSEIAEGNLHA